MHYRISSCMTAVILLAAISCSESESPTAPEQSHLPPVLVLTGTVEADGVGQESAVVDVYATQGGSSPCSGLVLDHETVITGRAGAFKVELRVDAPNEDAMVLSEIEACLRVSARPNGGSGWSLDEVPNVWFRQEAQADTIEITVQASLPNS